MFGLEKIPERFKSKYLEESIKHNFNFLFYASLAMIFIEIFLIISSMRQGGIGREKFYMYELALGISALFFAVFLHIKVNKNKSINFIRYAQYAFIITVILIITFYTIMNLRNTEDFHDTLFYVVTVMYLSTGLYMPFAFTISCVWFSFVILILGIVPIENQSVINYVMSILAINSVFTVFDVLSYNQRIISFTQAVMSEEHKERIAIANKKINEMMNRSNIAWIINRRSFSDSLSQKIEDEAEGIVERRTKLAVSLIQIEIDYFDLYIESYGIEESERCTTELAKVLVLSLNRDTDEVFRFAVGQFMLYLPSTNITGAGQVIKKIMENVKVLNIPNKSSPISERVTITAAVVSCEFDNKLSDITPILSHTENLLGAAVSEGRNRYRISSYNLNENPSEEAVQIGRRI
ncbi:hypothetical protein AGMMS49975_04450 [Clostridia bacterium]|nr:hypothetical protein AGMMS49975_04450 [Clostridia bacterium]